MKRNVIIKIHDVTVLLHRFRSGNRFRNCKKRSDRDKTAEHYFQSAVLLHFYQHDGSFCVWKHMTHHFEECSSCWWGCFQKQNATATERGADYPAATALCELFDTYNTNCRRATRNLMNLILSQSKSHNSVFFLNSENFEKKFRIQILILEFRRCQNLNSKNKLSKTFQNSESRKWSQNSVMFLSDVFSEFSFFPQTWNTENKLWILRISRGIFRSL